MHIFPLAFSVQLEFTAIEPNFPDLVLSFPDTKYIRVPAHFGRGAKITTRQVSRGCLRHQSTLIWLARAGPELRR